jgi:antitoxin ParD1/3/4
MRKENFSMPGIHKVSIALTSEQIDALKAVVDSGEYATTSEAIREAIRDWQFKRELRQDEIRQLRQLWDEGMASGKPQPVNFSRLRTDAQQRLRKMGKERTRAR